MVSQIVEEKPLAKRLAPASCRALFEDELNEEKVRMELREIR
jgi:hypothetical protein